MTTSQKGHRLCCASSFVIAAYTELRIVPQDELRRFCEFARLAPGFFDEAILY
jgi:hypothetical protein